MITLNSKEGQKLVREYISALNGDKEDIEWANNKYKAECDKYDDDDLKSCIDECFACI